MFVAAIRDSGAGPDFEADRGAMEGEAPVVFSREPSPAR